MAAPESTSIASLRSRICTLRSILEEIQVDARSLWESAPANSWVEQEADTLSEALYDIAGDLGELEDDSNDQEEGD